MPQLRRFIALLPDWDELAAGLDAIAIARGTDEYLGICRPGVVVITAWDQDLWWPAVRPEWIDECRDLLDLLAVEDSASEIAGHVELRWTEPQARAFMLLDVLVHELGHHHDRMTTAGADAPRGEPYAFAYARRVQDEIWSAYVDEFGI